MPSCKGFIYLFFFSLWTRRRIVPDPDGGSGVDIVSFGLFSSDVLLCLPGLCVLLSSVSVLLCSIFPWVVGLSGCLGFECVLVVFIFKSSAATVGLIVTVFSCWGVCLFSWCGRQPPLLGGICIVGLCECCSLI